MTFSRNFVRIVRDEAIAEHASLKFTVWILLFGTRIRVRGQSGHTYILFLFLFL